MLSNARVMRSAQAALPALRASPARPPIGVVPDLNIPEPEMPPHQADNAEAIAIPPNLPIVLLNPVLAPLNDEEKELINRYLAHVCDNMLTHVLSAHEQVILFRVRQRFAGVEARASFVSCKSADFAEVSIVASMEDKELVNEYCTIVNSMSASGRQLVFRWMRSIVEVGEDVVVVQAPVAEDIGDTRSPRKLRHDELLQEVGRANIAYFSGDASMFVNGTKEIAILSVAQVLQCQGVKPKGYDRKVNASLDEFLAESWLEGSKGKLCLSRFLFWGLVTPRPFLAEIESKELIVNLHDEFPMEPFFGYDEEAEPVLRKLANDLLYQSKLSSENAIIMRGERFSRAKAFRDKESTGVVARLLASTLDSIFHFDSEARLAVRELIRYVFSFENHRGVNSDGSGWNQNIHEFYNVITIDALRRLWVKLQDSALLHRMDMIRDIRGDVEAILCKERDDDSRRFFSSLGTSLATLRNNALDLEFIKRYPIKYPTSMQRLKAAGIVSGVKRGRGTENSHGTKVSRGNVDNVSPRHICFHSVSALDESGCKNERCTYHHPKLAEYKENRHEDWKYVADRLMNEGQAVNHEGQLRHNIHPAWLDWARQRATIAPTRQRPGIRPSFHPPPVPPAAYNPARVALPAQGPHPPSYASVTAGTSQRR